jgi:hypothetical protein
MGNGPQFHRDTVSPHRNNKNNINEELKLGMTSGISSWSIDIKSPDILNIKSMQIYSIADVPVFVPHFQLFRETWKGTKRLWWHPSNKSLQFTVVNTKMTRFRFELISSEQNKKLAWLWNSCIHRLQQVSRVKQEHNFLMPPTRVSITFLVSTSILLKRENNHSLIIKMNCHILISMYATKHLTDRSITGLNLWKMKKNKTNI